MRHVEREILSALVDGELAPDHRRLVHEHLQECSACREIVEEFGQIHGMVVDLPRLVAPESFVSDVLRPARISTVRKATAAAVRGRRRWVWVGAAATAVAITLAGLVAPTPASEPPVDVLIERHVGVHSGAEAGGQVLFSVDGR